MILRGARVACSPAQAEIADIEIALGRIRTLGRVNGNNALDFGRYLMLPGLINAHDHLEFNLFPRLGKGPYESAAEWATDIHARFAEPIREVLSVPREDRLIWGGLRNLSCGVTTVCHHNPWEPLFDNGFPVRVVRRVSWAHSLDFSQDLAERHGSCPATRPFIFHAGEAVNGAGREEMTALARLGLFAPNSVMVHAVALDEESLALALGNGCAVIWCPSSNLFILGKTLSGGVLASGLRVALGTDSGLSAEGDMLDELRIAREISGLDEERLYGMVTTAAAGVLRLANGEGSLCQNGVADFLLYEDTGLTPAEALFQQLPAAVFIRGRAQLVTEEFAAAWEGAFPQIARFQRLAVDGRGAVRVRCRVPSMPAGLRLAGRQVALLST